MTGSEETLSDQSTGGAPKETRGGNQTIWRAFFGRLLRLFLRPTRYWQSVDEVGLPPARQLVFPHLTILALLRGAAGLVGSLAQESGVDKSVVYAISSFLATFVVVGAMAMLVVVMAKGLKGEASIKAAFSWVALALTPLFVVGTLGAVPVPYFGAAAEMLALPYAFYVMAVGIDVGLNVKPERQAKAASLLAGGLLVLWTLAASLTFIRGTG